MAPTILPDPPLHTLLPHLFRPIHIPLPYRGYHLISLLPFNKRMDFHDILLFFYFHDIEWAEIRLFQLLKDYILILQAKVKTVTCSSIFFRWLDKLLETFDRDL